MFRTIRSTKSLYCAFQVNKITTPLHIIATIPIVVGMMVSRAKAWMDINAFGGNDNILDAFANTIRSEILALTTQSYSNYLSERQQGMFYT